MVTTLFYPQYLPTPSPHLFPGGHTAHISISVSLAISLSHSPSHSPSIYLLYVMSLSIYLFNLSTSLSLSLLHLSIVSPSFLSVLLSFNPLISITLSKFSFLNNLWKLSVSRKVHWNNRSNICNGRLGGGMCGSWGKGSHLGSWGARPARRGKRRAAGLRQWRRIDVAGWPKT